MTEKKQEVVKLLYQLTKKNVYFNSCLKLHFNVTSIYKYLTL